jgi:hypothetical protein
MKTFKLFIFIYYCFLPFTLFAQVPQAIEADLLRSFKRINDAYQKANNDTTDNDRLVDVISNANEAFGKKLVDYANKYPLTISYPFSSLKQARLDISTSSDGMFRIYSWDTETGGTMHFFESVFQYKVGTKTIAVLDAPESEGDNRPNYNKLYVFKADSKTYYLAAYSTIASAKDAGNGIQAFSVENGKLNQDVKIIKTRSGMHSSLGCGYNFFYVVNEKARPSVYFDAATKSIYVPLVDGNGKVTSKFITYKFTGKYFEKIKP